MIFLNFIILLRVSWQTTNPQGSQDKNDCPNHNAHIQNDRFRKSTIERFAKRNTITKLGSWEISFLRHAPSLSPAQFSSMVSQLVLSLVWWFCWGFFLYRTWFHIILLQSRVRQLRGCRLDRQLLGEKVVGGKGGAVLLLGVNEGVDMVIVPQLECVGGLPHIVLVPLLAGNICSVHQA